MAACLEDSLLQSVCSVCFERYKLPRKLPSCAHSFCEECIVKYSTSLLENKEDGTPIELPCPLCREVNQLPADNTEVGKWVTSLELNEELAKSVETESQNELPEICARCKENCRPVIASKYCFECQEHLCEKCCRTGHGFKLLRDHSIIEISPVEYDKKQKELMGSMSVYTFCKRHPLKKLRFICVGEDKLCCDTCKDVLHNTCKDVQQIKEYANKVKIAEEAPKVKGKLSRLSDLSKVIIQRKNENEVSNKSDSQTILNKIQTMRQQMNQVFDALEDNVREQCKALTKKCAITEQEDISNLQDLIQSFGVSSKMLDNALENVPIDLAFIILHEMQSSIEKQETRVLEYRHDLQRFGLELTLGTSLKQLDTLRPVDASEMANIRIKKTETDLPKYLDRHLLRYSKITNMEKQCKGDGSFELLFTGMSLASDDKMLLADNKIGVYYLLDAEYNLIHSALLSDASGTCVKKVKKENKQLHGGSFIKCDTAAISVPKEKKIYFVTVHSEQTGIIGEVRFRHEPAALHGLTNGDIAVSWDNPVAFGILTFHQCFSFDEKVYFDRDQTGRVIKSFLYMGVDEDRSHVIQPCTIDKAVFCFDFEGVPKFTYKHLELTRPMGVAIDPDGAIYVCDRDHNSIHIISPTGEPARILRDEIPDRPVNLLFKRKRNEIVVASDQKPYVGLCVFKFGT